jgi:hypothetical protein
LICEQKKKSLVAQITSYDGRKRSACRLPLLQFAVTRFPRFLFQCSAVIIIIIIIIIIVVVVVVSCHRPFLPGTSLEPAVIIIIIIIT